MPNKTYPLVLLICAITLAGCAAPKSWRHSSKGQTEFHQDRYLCQQEAAQSYPAMIVQRMTPGVQIPDNRSVQTNCSQVGNFVQCNSAKTGIDATIYNRPPSVVAEDANAANRNYAAQSCMYARGWQLQ